MSGEEELPSASDSDNAPIIPTSTAQNTVTTPPDSSGPSDPSSGPDPQRNQEIGHFNVRSGTVKIRRWVGSGVPLQTLYLDLKCDSGDLEFPLFTSPEPTVRSGSAPRPEDRPGPVQAPQRFLIDLRTSRVYGPTAGEGRYRLTQQEDIPTPETESLSSNQPENPRWGGARNRSRSPPPRYPTRWPR